MSLASVARETREVVDAAPRASHPVICVDTSSASGTFSAKLPVDRKIKARIKKNTQKKNRDLVKRGLDGEGRSSLSFV